MYIYPLPMVVSLAYGITSIILIWESSKTSMKYRIREPLLMVYIIHTNGIFTLYTLNIEPTPVLNCESRTPKLHTHGMVYQA